MDIGNAAFLLQKLYNICSLSRGLYIVSESTGMYHAFNLKMIFYREWYLFVCVLLENSLDIDICYTVERSYLWFERSGCKAIKNSFRVNLDKFLDAGIENFFIDVVFKRFEQ